MIAVSEEIKAFVQSLKMLQKFFAEYKDGQDALRELDSRGCYSAIPHSKRDEIGLSVFSEYAAWNRVFGN